MTRNPSFNGRFYASGRIELKRQIKECFLSEFGPGMLPGKKEDNVIAGISPHAGYQFSGPASAFTYKSIAESKDPDLYIILGVSHQGFSSCVSLEDWKTPLGIAKNDAEFGKVLAENAKIEINEELHQKEHSIEVQLPFLQFISESFRFSPLMVSNDINPKILGEKIRKTSEQMKKKIIVIASSDFTHYGPAYGYVPFSSEIKKNMYNLDIGAVDAIRSLNPEKFQEYLRSTGATVCGQMPISVLLNSINSKKAELLKYYTSGDISGDYSNAVGYSSIIFR